MSSYSKSGLDWYRSKNTESAAPVRRGNLSLLATAEFRDGQMVSTPVTRQRYVWPNPYHQVQSGILTRKIYAR